MSGGGRQIDVFQLNGGDVFSYLAANWRCFKFSDVFYGIDGSYHGEKMIRMIVGTKRWRVGGRYLSLFTQPMGRPASATTDGFICRRCCCLLTTSRQAFLSHNEIKFP